MPGSEIESRKSHKLEFRVRLPTWPLYLCSLMDRADGYEPSDGGSIPSRGTLKTATAVCAATKIATWLSNMVQMVGQGPSKVPYVGSNPAVTRWIGVKAACQILNLTVGVQVPYPILIGF